jgi:ferredoxin
MCSDVAPAVFDLDDDGELVILLDEDAAVPVALVPSIRDAIASCPVAALRES